MRKYIHKLFDFRNIIPDNNGDDIKSQLRCNTEKSKQLAKNRKTAGNTFLNIVHI